MKTHDTSMASSTAMNKVNFNYQILGDSLSFDKTKGKYVGKL